MEREENWSRSEDEVKAVGTSLTIVETLKQMNGGKAATIVEQTGLSKGAVYKHLSTLKNHDFVVKRGKEYHLSFRFLDYGGWLRSRYPGSEMIKPHILGVAQKTNEVALFAIVERGRVITLYRENGNEGVFTRTRLGRHLYPNQTAGGKAILSELPESQLRTIIETVGLPKATENTITEEDKLMAELERIRERGYALNQEESTEGLIAVSVPLVPEETVLGACSVAGPRHRLDEERIQEDVIELLLSVVNALELNISHSLQSANDY